MLFGKYRLRIQFHEDARIPPYKGSTLRGGFGAALKTVMCGSVKRSCQECRIFERCLYAQTFETRPGASLSPHSPAPPHPYVIEPPLDEKNLFAPGDALEFGLLLFGKSNDYLAFFLHATSLMGKRGIGRGREGPATFSLTAAYDAGGSMIFDPEGGRLLGDPQPQELILDTTRQDGCLPLRLSFVTPFRMKYMNQLHDEVPFHVLVRATLRRISSLFNHHGEGEPDIDYKGLVHRAMDVPILASSLRWLDWTRYSNRQQSKMLLGGIVGSITYADVPGEYIPLLSLARQVHLGKQTSFGLGRIDFTWQGGSS
ncbi:CRISPR system precrRNA processing endoribonuclease RAMP protein Cas6 [Desulfolutivibrio sulfoxidireducens]|uniref:CRISPR system precrRNA processing endoribonuclease RAMP protein Cas6 n=1 Tax=Desulfolutivibrio sulfoxidireducens TaxID=2773299 RepID=UPI00159DA304|nr:CRISPR system precrRNA processing endoribonuclease RAMP protein Cas6 [Desulfolutivibrio sulfoxidireducens]QLA19328.1 CRISPR system precrRNA processing endoribonuclease RAMP protein Cas6 [Desulfolutivibrio sulfoxidireducens]